MNDLFHILRFEWKLLWRSNMIKFLLLVMLGVGIYGIYFGKFEIEKQNARITEVKQYEQAQFDSLLTWVKLDTSILANKEKFQKAVLPEGAGRNYHFNYCSVHEASPIAGLCLGQRDLFPVYYQLNMTDLTRQLNKGELVNPMKLLTGNFDLSYVFIFLLPLLVISLFFNLYAAEKEGGMLYLLRAQSSSIDIIFLAKGILRFLIILVISTLLLVLGFLIQEISIVENINLFSQWLFTVLIYSLLWSLIMAWIISLKKGTAVSAILGLGTWLLVTLISPALLNLIASANNPLPNRAEITHSIRELSSKNWDSPKSYVLNKFYSENPQFIPQDTTHFYKWYYAGFSVLDKDLKPIKEEFETQVDSRNNLLENWMWISPAAMMHEHLSSISKTDRESHMLFVESTRDYHNRLRNIYFDKIFGEENFSEQELRELQAMKSY